MRVLLLGSPGAGKGTQSARLAERFEVPHIATGDMFREALALNTKMGLRARTYMDDGRLVPDGVVIGMVEERFLKNDVRSGFILDGFPRTRTQAEAFKELSEGMGLPLCIAIALDVSDELIIKRIAGRRICRKTGEVFHVDFKPPSPEKAGQYDLYQRADDSEETVRDRLVTYHRDTAPLIDFYRNEGLLTRVDGTGSMAEVFERLVAVVSEAKVE